MRLMKGIRAKLLGYTAVLILLVSGFLTTYSIVSNRSQMLEIYEEDTIEIGSALSEAVFNDLYQMDLRGLRLRLSAVLKNKTIAATFILDQKGHVLADGTGENILRGKKLDDSFVQRILDSKDSEDWVIDIGPELFKIGRPVALEAAEPIGLLYLQFSLKFINERILTQLKENLIISGVCVLLGLWSAMLFSLRFTRPIMELTHAASLVISGDTTVEIPVTGRDEIRLLSISLEEMLRRLRASDRELREINVSLDQKVQERTLELEKVLKIIHSSILYSSKIQRSILPSDDFLQQVLPQHFVAWHPRDVVGGDIYWCRSWGEGILIALGDCTGHGVPGAFVTLIANGALGHAMRTTQPGEINTLIKSMHYNMLEVMGQDTSSEEYFEDGLEIGVCYISSAKRDLLFAGAHFSLYYQDPSQPIQECPGGRHGIGCRSNGNEPQFTEHTVPLLPNRRFILTTDGMIDQVGGEKRRGFGEKRFLELLYEQQNTPIQDVGTRLYDALVAYQGDNTRRDDVTIIGFTV